MITQNVELPGYESCTGLTLEGELLMPKGCTDLLVFAHGAGAGFDHENMLGIARGLATHNIASLRFNFPFMQQGRRRVDSREVTTAAIASAVDWVHRKYPKLALGAGGHSFGGRMTSHCELEYELPVKGLIFCSFPLHAANKPNRLRAAHLPYIEKPMLFLTGTRDALAEPMLLTEVLGQLRDKATLRWLDTADHGYKTLKRQRLYPGDVFEEIGQHIQRFIEDCNASQR